MFFVTKVLSDRNCDRFLVYVSANNVLGESERSGVEGTFPIGIVDPYSPLVLHCMIYVHLSKLLSGYLARILLKWNRICNPIETERCCWP